MQQIETVVVQKQERLLPGIHGLRGTAALAVVLYHLVHVGSMKPPDVFGFIGRDFGYSVHLFFVLSAFSLMYSTQPTLGRPNWLADYLTKRFFRIAPLFYCMVVFEAGRQWVMGGAAPPLTTLLLNFSFAFGAVPFSGIVWGGWSVGVEMIFYAIFPVLILQLRDHRSALAFLLLSLLVSYVTRAALTAQHFALTPQPKWDWSYFSFAPNLCFFAMGIYAFHVSRRFAASAPVLNVLAAAAIVLIGALLLTNLGKRIYTLGRPDILLWGAGLACLCAWQSLRPSRIFASPAMAYLGERSFSIYLLHPVIIAAAKDRLAGFYELLQPALGAYAYFACAILVVAIVLAASEVSYRLVEAPGIRLGRRLIVRSTA